MAPTCTAVRALSIVASRPACFLASSTRYASVTCLWPTIPVPGMSRYDASSGQNSCRGSAEIDSKRSLAESMTASSPARKWKRISAPWVIGRLQTGSLFETTLPPGYSGCVKCSDVLRRDGPTAAESGKTVVAHFDSGARRSLCGLENHVANHPAEAVVLVVRDGFGDVIRFIGNIESYPHSSSIT